MTSNWRIPLVKDTINRDDINHLIEWLYTEPKLTKGDQTILFENQWSQWQGRKYSIFVNSGSSANLAMIYALQISGKMKNNKIIVPAVSWVTTVAPVIQLGMIPIICETDEDTLGINIDHLKQLFETERPAALIIVHVLGFPNKMDEILKLCLEYDVLLLEDSCESVGSTYKSNILKSSVKTGNFGIMSSFSTYFGHHFSTIEGGIINTDDEDLYHILLSIRSHGWDRDLPEKEKKRLRDQEKISEFRALYTFYHPGFNLRSTDLQAFLGLIQLKKLDKIIQKRNENFLLYDSLIKKDLWKIKTHKDIFISNFAYPIITNPLKFVNLINLLKKEGIESRPLVCGSIVEQPFWKNRYGNNINFPFQFSKIVHNQGLYLPNNHQISKEDIEIICKVVNKILL